MADLQRKDVTVKFRYCFFQCQTTYTFAEPCLLTYFAPKSVWASWIRLEEEETSCYSNDGNRLHHRRHTYYMFFNVSTLVLEFKKSRVGVKDVREAFVCMSICHHQFF